MLVGVFWLFFFCYLFYFLVLKVKGFGGLVSFFDVVMAGFRHQGAQSSFFFKFFVCLLLVFWLTGIFFPLFSLWSGVGVLFFLTSFSWLSVRVFTLLGFSFVIFYEEESSWDWVTSLVMFFSHLLSFLMSGLALTLRISIIFLIGHFLMFFLVDFGGFLSFCFLFFVLPLECFFAFLQSYIFLTLVCMFLLNMI